MTYAETGGHLFMLLVHYGGVKGGRRGGGKERALAQGQKSSVT